MAQTTPGLESIWSEYRASLLAFLRSKVSNQDDADDLLQEILLKAHEGMSGLGKVESLKAWLFQIASNTITDYYRSKGRHKPIHPDDLWYNELDQDDQHVLENCIAPFINALPAEMGELLHKIDLQGVSQKSHAAELGVSYSTLKSQVQAGRRQLRKLFEDCCNFSLDSKGNIVGYERKKDNCGPC
ncbi:RNA polymerase sigma factor SigZ [Ruegeria arenilitoris]|uniref:RNA polymerase sigma factor SigZ n=1 Tax=Ruegeria arenilitoris TaxID=1173585 RepID=UPI00147E26E4|nr:RNA polymerase sigma factor SigZ [Ruegeria arenilitoris]